MGILEQLVLKEYKVVKDYLGMTDRKVVKDYPVVKEEGDQLVHLVFQDKQVRRVYQALLVAEIIVLNLMALT